MTEVTEATIGQPARAGLLAGLVSGMKDPTRSPADDGIAFEDIYFPAADGVTIEGWFIPVTATS